MANETEPRQQEIYADLLTGQVLLGGAALETHFETGGHPADVRPVRELLDSDELDGLRSDHYHKRSETHWTERDCITYGQWIIGLVSKSNRKILYRGKILGLGIGPEQIKHPDRCGSLANLYTKLEGVGASINKAFHGWGTEDLADNLAQFGQELGRKPTEEDVRQRSKEHPDQPYVYAFVTRFGDFRSALEAAGWPNIYNWGEKEHVAQGVKFMLANDGTKPTQLAWDFLSTKKKGASAATIPRIFPGGFTEFKELVDQSYQIAREGQCAHLKEVGQEIKHLMAAGEVDINFFHGAKSGRELAERFAKYKVISQILPNMTYQEKLGIISSSPSFSHFTNCVQLYSPNSSVGSIENLSKNLGLYEDLGSLNSYMRTLRIIDNPEFIRKKEKWISRNREWRKERAKDRDLLSKDQL